MIQNSICCTCLQQKPAMFYPLSGGQPGQPSFREKLNYLTTKLEFINIVNAIICHKCSYFLDQGYKFKYDCEMAANRFISYARKISAINKPFHCFASIEQAAGLNLVLHKIDDTINNYSLILGVTDLAYIQIDDDSDSSCYILSDVESEHIDISDTERSVSPLPDAVMPSLSPQTVIPVPREPSEFQCKQCPMTFFTRQNLKRHKRVHDQALDTINANIKHHLITDEDIRSIIGILPNQRPTVSYTYFNDNPLQDHTYFSRDNTQQNDFEPLPPVLSPQTELRNHKKPKIPLYADLVGASSYKQNPKPKSKYQKGKSKSKKRHKSGSVSVFSKAAMWKYDPKVVLIKDDILEQRARNEVVPRKPPHIVNIIPKCVHNFLDDSCRTKTTLLYGNMSKGIC